MRPNVGVIWCATSAKNRSNGWSFPPHIERQLRELTQGQTVLQLFGGLATWGTKLDIDPLTRPHVIGDAWLPPFVKNAFDVVILDPPYYNSINQQMRASLLRASSYIAREHVIWFHTLWLEPYAGLRLEQSWLVRAGKACAGRCLQVFRSPAEKPTPVPYFTRGPAIKYNRWIVQPERLPFE